jgi:uncharacterized protein
MQKALAMNTDEQGDTLTVWNAGEIAMQSSVGVADRMAEVGRRAFRDHLTDQHRQFYPLLPFVVLGAVDPAGNAWATLRGSRPGFMRASSPHRLSIRIPRDPGDPADAGMEDGDSLGLLGIDLFTRRRNRLNGPVSRNSGDGFDLVVEQSYGNCPRYIQMREFSFTRDPVKLSAEPAVPQEATDDRARALIQSADTLFVASYVERETGQRQVDVSHRGGKPGFVRIGPDGVITIPDFAGNMFFNTLGNFLVNPKGGLVFPDWETGDLLQLTGDVEVILDSPEIKDFQGAERFWRFRPHQILRRPNALPLRWAVSPEGWSPNSLMTGSWAEVARRQKAATPTSLGSSASCWRATSLVSSLAVFRGRVVAARRVTSIVDQQQTAARPQSAWRVGEGEQAAALRRRAQRHGDRDEDKRQASRRRATPPSVTRVVIHPPRNTDAIAAAFSSPPPMPTTSGMRRNCSAVMPSPS